MSICRGLLLWHRRHCHRAALGCQVVVRNTCRLDRNPTSTLGTCTGVLTYTRAAVITTLRDFDASLFAQLFAPRALLQSPRLDIEP